MPRAKLQKKIECVSITSNRYIIMTDAGIRIPATVVSPATVQVREDPFWGEDANILFHVGRLREFFPTRDQSVAERLNAFTRLAIYISIAIALYQSRTDPLQIGGIIVGLIFFMWKTQTVTKSNEQFTTMRPVPPRLISDEAMYTETGERPCVQPTRENPFANFLPGDDPTRPPACRGPGAQAMAANMLDSQLFNDVDDLYSRNSSQRMFRTMPSTTRVPNREQYSNWLFNGAQQGCKSDPAACGPSDDLRLQRQMIPEELDGNLLDVTGFSF